LGKNLQSPVFEYRGINKMPFRWPNFLKITEIRIDRPCKVSLHLPRGEYEEEKEQGITGLAGGPIHAWQNANSLPSRGTGRRGDITPLA